MLTWKDIENFVKNGVSAPENKVIKTEEEWKKLLSDDVFSVSYTHLTLPTTPYV